MPPRTIREEHRLRNKSPVFGYMGDRYSWKALTPGFSLISGPVGRGPRSCGAPSGSGTTLRPSVPSRSTSCPGKLSGLVGRLDHEYAAAVIERAGVAFRQAGVDPVGVLSRGARITHGIGLPMADALIAASLEHQDCARVHTSDSDFEEYEGPMEVVFL